MRAVYSCADTWDPVVAAEFLVGETTRSYVSCGKSVSAHPVTQLSSPSWPWPPVSRLLNHHLVSIYQGIQMIEVTLRSGSLAFRALCGGHLESSEKSRG